MRTRRLVVLAAATAVLTIGLGSGTSSARQLAYQNWGSNFGFTVQNFMFSLPLGSVSCPYLHLGWTFITHTANKTRGQQTARLETLEERSLRECTGGTVRLLTETLPWRVTYDAFAGTLPNITSVRSQIIGAAFLILREGISCLMRSTETSPLRIIETLRREAGGELEVSEIRIEERSSIPMSGFCGNVTMSGGGTVLTNAIPPAPIRIALI